MSPTLMTSVLIKWAITFMRLMLGISGSLKKVRSSFSTSISVVSMESIDLILSYAFASFSSLLDISTGIDAFWKCPSISKYTRLFPGFCTKLSIVKSSTLSGSRLKFPICSKMTLKIPSGSVFSVNVKNISINLLYPSLHSTSKLCLF